MTVHHSLTSNSAHKVMPPLVLPLQKRKGYAVFPQMGFRRTEQVCEHRLPPFASTQCSPCLPLEAHCLKGSNSSVQL